MKVIIEEKDIMFKQETSRKIFILFSIIEVFRNSCLVSDDTKRELEKTLMYLSKVDRQLMMEIKGVVEDL